MKISLVTNNTDFIQFLETRAVGMSILNSYSTLTDSVVLDKFKEDYNHVDIFLFLDFQDLSAEFRQFLNYVKEGRSYFLNAKEIVVITNKSEELSPTKDLETTLTAMQSFTETAKLQTRVVRLESMKFQDIYKSLTSSDSMRSAEPQKLIKYKVSHNSAGEIISPEKNDVSIVPDRLKGMGAKSKLEDLKSAPAWENTQVDVPSVIEGKRKNKTFKDNTSLAKSSETLTIFITGVRYSGKTTLGLTIANELQNDGSRSLLCDLTSRDDYYTVNRSIGCDIGRIKGLSANHIPQSSVLTLHVFKKVYSSIFLNTLIRGLSTATKVTIVEVDPEEFNDMYSSFVGDKIVLVPIQNTSVCTRDTIQVINNLKVPVYPVINSIVPDVPIDKKALMLTATNSTEVLDINDLTGFIQDVVG